jgi:hypothetical protein
MLRNAIRWGIIAAALAAPFMGACLNTSFAENCHILENCPPPDGGPDADVAADASDQG